MENILLAFIEEHARHSNPLYQLQIQKEARTLTENIEKQYYGSQAKCSNFKASNGWFWRFCERKKVKHVNFFGESAQVDENVVKDFVSEFEQIAKQYNNHLIFNFDECGLFWRKSPTGGYTTASKPAVAGPKTNKTRVTLLLGNLKLRLSLS